MDILAIICIIFLVCFLLSNIARVFYFKKNEEDVKSETDIFLEKLENRIKNTKSKRIKISNVTLKAIKNNLMYGLISDEKIEGECEINDILCSHHRMIFQHSNGTYYSAEYWSNGDKEFNQFTNRNPNPYFWCSEVKHLGGGKFVDV